MRLASNISTTTTKMPKYLNLVTILLGITVRNELQLVQICLVLIICIIGFEIKEYWEKIPFLHCKPIHCRPHAKMLILCFTFHTKSLCLSKFSKFQKCLNQYQACLYLFKCISHGDFKYSHEIPKFDNMVTCLTCRVESIKN